jgi:4-amino-4-deoxy-L-arabinose transferase-like glycosyltransferase
MLKRFLPLLLFFFLFYPLFFHGLGDRDLWSSHEARAGQNARMMLETGDWALPRLLDGKPDLQKPPLYYWLVAGLAKLRGQVDAWAIRLPATVAAVGCVLVMFGFLHWLGRPAAGLLAGLSLATMIHFTWMGRVGRIDMPLSLCVTVMIAASHLARVGQRENGKQGWHWLLLAYLAAGVSILLKGPVGIVLSAPVILASAISESWGAARAAVKQLGWGAMIVLAIVLPWFLYANQATDGEFFRTFLFRHNVQRALGGDEQFDTHFHPWWYYGYRLAIDLQPWCALLPFAAWWLVRRGGWRNDPEARLGCIWLIGMVLTLSLIDYKRADYLLPAYAGAAILLGCTGERLLANVRGWRLRAAKWSVGTVVAAAVLGWFGYVEVLLPRWEASRELRSFAHAVRQRATPHGMVILFRVESHPLTFHLARPWDRIMEWENLQFWVQQPVPIHVVMLPEAAAEWRNCLEAGELVQVLTSDELAGGKHAEPLVLLCTRPPGTYNDPVAANPGK